MKGSYGTVPVKVKQINKSYMPGEITVYALKDVSSELYKGELIVILRPNGLGENMLLSILGGIETATSGKPLYGGKELDRKDKKTFTAYCKAHVGFVFRFYNPMPGLAVLENVGLTAELGEHSLDVGGLMEQVGLTDRADHFPNKLSGGQQRRAAITRALYKNPDILLCDEPAGALSSRTGVQILKLLVDFNRAYQEAVVLITHNRKIAQVAHRVFYFKDGCLERIRQNESPLRPKEMDWQ